MGNIRLSRQPKSGRAVHPHVCGEHVQGFPTLEVVFGSSPRVWGTFSNVRDRAKVLRFIPTCVGNIITTAQIASDKTLRFIPTCVGNMTLSNVRLITSSVHPHVCGEHFDDAVLVTSAVRFIPTCVGNMTKALGEGGTQRGSSPRVWGTFVYNGGAGACRRFIPTCVGNIRSASGL